MKPSMEIPTMKTRIALGAMFLCLALAAGVPVRAEGPATQAPPEPAQDHLTVVFVDALRGNNREFDNYDRVAWIFPEVFKARKWPMKVDVERFGSNSPAYPVELRVYFKGIRRETPVDLVFTAWVTLNDHGKKTDFGIVRYRYDVRPTELVDDRLDNVFRGAAKRIAEKVEPVLFPKLDRTKP
jgi:hypothetical protein